MQDFFFSSRNQKSKLQPVSQSEEGKEITGINEALQI